MNALNAFTVTIVNLFLVAYSDTSIAFFGAYFKIQQLIIMTINGLIQGCLPIMIQIFRQMFFFDTYYVDFRKSITNQWYLDCISSY